MGHVEEACHSNIIKYAMRYGKKDGYNKKALRKIIHYNILLWHFTQDNDNPPKEFKPEDLKL